MIKAVNNKEKRNFFSTLTKSQKILLFAGVPIIAFSILPVLVVLVIGLLPTITILITDFKNSSKLTIVGCFNLAGVFIYVFNILQQYTINGAIDIVFDVFKLIVMLGSAAIGIVIYSEFPSLFASTYKVMARKHVRKIDAKLEKFKEDWGDNIITQAAGPSSSEKPDGKEVKKAKPVKEG